jgi:hypothetical protein
MDSTINGKSLFLLLLLAKNIIAANIRLQILLSQLGQLELVRGSEPKSLVNLL